MRCLLRLSWAIFLLLSVNLCFSQGKNVTGTVISEKDNDGLNGVTVTNKSTKKYTLTNGSGYFSIAADAGQVLEFSSIGFNKKQVTVGNDFTLKITMTVNTLKESEAVVTAMGAKKNARSIPYATQTIKGEEAAETQRDNWMNSITGRVAGASVNATSGSPGASSQIVLRGFNSIGGDNSALIIVDGIPLNNNVFNQARLASDLPNRNNDYTNRAADINPDDIESITVLKGPEAAALYGTEAGNGAIIITTKRAKVQRLKVAYENNFRFEQITRFHDVQKVYDNGANGVFTNTTRSFFGPKYAPGTVFYNNAKNFFDIGSTTKHNISVEGGRGATAIRANIAYFNQLGVIPNTQNRRINSRVTLSSRMSKSMEVFGTISYTSQYNVKAFRGTDGYYAALLRWPLDDDARKWRNINGNRRIISKSAGVDDPAEANNPYFETEKNRNQDRMNRVTFNAGYKWDAKSWLNVDWKLGADVYSQTGLTLRDKESFDVYTVGGRIEDYIFRYQGYSSILAVTAKKNIGKFSGALKVGHALDDRTSKSWSVRGDSINIPSDKIPRTSDLDLNTYTSLFKRLNSRTQGRDTLTLQRSIGLFGELSVNYDELVYLTLTGRNDWLAEFPPDRRSYFYPALGVSFLFGDLLPKNNFLTYGKYRLSVAKTGKRVAPYSNQSVYTNAVSSTNGYGNAYGFGANNPDLFPEQQSTFETGTELKFLNNKIGLDFTYYKINIKNSVAANARPSYATGFILYTANIADLWNEGYEATLNLNLVKNKKMSWNTRINFNKMHNKVTRLPLPEFYNSDSWLAGYRASLYRGLPTTTIGGQDYLRNNKGQILIDPGTGYPLTDPNYVRIGDRNPDFVIGLTNNFSFKTLRLGFTLDWKQGGDVLNGTEQFLVQQGLSLRTLDREQTRIIPGVLNDGLQNSATPSVNTIPITPYYQNDYYQGRTYAVDYVEKDVNWLRLRDVTLNYTAGKVALQKLKVFSSFNLFVTGTDLFILTNYSGVDPSVNGNTPATGGVGGFAIDLNNTPTPIGINFGMRVSFKNGKK
jgi:TonB-linked SusC/RagA family outer membrane protein